ncbi:MAG: hypothetical protein HFE72_02565 [Emergencia sp.]|nr:hypothetical protein [Emergencia sp.]
MLRENPRVCLSYACKPRREEYEFTAEYESTVVFGSAIELINKDEKTDALRELCQRNRPVNMNVFDETIEQSLAHTAVWKSKAI